MRTARGRGRNKPRRRPNDRERSDSPAWDTSYGGIMIKCGRQGRVNIENILPPPPAHLRNFHLETLLSHKREHRAEPSISHDMRFHDAEGACPVVVVVAAAAPRLGGLLLFASLCFLLEDVSSVLYRLSRKQKRQSRETRARYVQTCLLLLFLILFL